MALTMDQIAVVKEAALAELEVQRAEQALKATQAARWNAVIEVRKLVRADADPVTIPLTTDDVVTVSFGRGRAARGPLELAYTFSTLVEA